jgi:hypothetical protein
MKTAEQVQARIEELMKCREVLKDAKPAREDCEARINTLRWVLDIVTRKF